MKNSLIIPGIILCTSAFAQSNIFVASMENAEHFSIGSFVSINKEEPIKAANYTEETYKTPDGGTGMLLKFGKDEMENNRQNLAFEVKLFPNPTTGFFSVETNAKSTMNIFIYDVLGRTIFQSMNIDVQYVNLDFSSKSRGIYFVKVQCGDSINISRIVIQ